MGVVLIEGNLGHCAKLLVVSEHSTVKLVDGHSHLDVTECNICLGCSGCAH